MNQLEFAANQISIFCRLHMNTKQQLPIRASEMGLLIYLVKTDKEHSPLAAAKFFNVSKAMITNMISSLSKKEYLYKTRNVKDKRYWILHPTQKAVDLVNETYTDHFKLMALLQEKLGSKQFEQFINTIQQINTIIVEEQHHG